MFPVEIDTSTPMAYCAVCRPRLLVTPAASVQHLPKATTQLAVGSSAATTDLSSCSSSSSFDVRGCVAVAIATAFGLHLYSVMLGEPSSVHARS